MRHSGVPAAKPLRQCAWRNVVLSSCFRRRPGISSRPPCASATPQCRDLWDYAGSCVTTIQLDSYKLFHRLSFGHRNPRTYVVMLYDPASPSCRAAEYEVERLATGLRHCPAVVVAKLNAADPNNRAFLTSTFPGVVEQLPAVLLYPEAATGHIRLKGRNPTADGILRGINKLHSIVLPQRSELKLQDVPEEQLVREVYGGPDGLARQRKKERLVKVMEKVADAREQKAAAASATAAATEAVNGAPGAEELRVRSAAPAVVTSVAPPSAMAVSYWSREKATTWGVVAGLSFFAFAWDMWLAAAWDRWQVHQRQRKRARGVSFGAEQDLLDMGTMMLDSLEDTVLNAAQPLQPPPQSSPLSVRLPGGKLRQQQHEHQQVGRGSDDGTDVAPPAGGGLQDLRLVTTPA